jgi:predicted HAD superfamily hydrolase
LIKNLDAKVYSFDVFDTAIVRSTAEPQGIFHLMKLKISILNLLSTSEVENFVRLRRDSENQARKRKKGQEISIADIYSVLSEKLSLKQDITSSLIHLEEEEELNNARAVPSIVSLINELRKIDKRIIFISDIYLSKQLIEKMLRRIGIFKTGDGLYVSSDCKLTKASGSLFTYVLKNENCLSDDLVHIGDNRASDIKVAKRLGIRAIYFPETKLNRYERTIVKKGKGENECTYAWQVLAGSSRIARLQYQSKNNKSLFILGTSVAGPLLFGYILWLVRQVQTLKINRLYFLARDGQILSLLWKIISSKLNLDVDFKYLYGSRQAWHLPAITSLGKRELDLLLLVDPQLSLDILSHRISIDKQIIYDVVRSTGENWRTSDALNQKQIQKLRSLLSRSPLRNMILQQAEAKRSLCFSYFSQEGLLDDVSCAIVDMGWHGNLQDSLSKIIGPFAKKNKIYGFYFGLRRSKNNFFDSSLKKAFLFDYDISNPSSIFSSKRNRRTEYSSLLEIFTAADHGSTISYVKSNGHWNPLLKEASNQCALSWGLEDLRSGIIEYFNNVPNCFLNELIEKLDLDGFKNRLVACIMSLYLNPSYQEAMALGTFPFSSDQTEIIMREFAPPFSIKRIGKLSGAQFHTYWIEGSLTRSSSMSKALFPIYFQLNRINRYIHPNYSLFE